LTIAAALALVACSSKPPPPVIASFTAAPASITIGGSASLQFQVTGADKLQIDQGVGDVTGGTSATVSPTTTTTYTLSATNKGGTATAQTTLNVTQLPAQLISFTATPGSSAVGQPVTLQWKTAYVSALKLTAAPTPAAALPQLGPTDKQATVNPTVTTVYTLTATGSAGTQQPAPLSVLVFVAPAPTLTLSSDAASVARGSAAKLSWTSDGAAIFTLVTTPHGGTAARTALGAVTSTRVRPLADTDYAIEAVGEGGSTTSNSVTVAVTGAAASGLAYTAPTPAPADVVSLNLRSIVGAVATFDLVTLKAVTAGAMALELPLDAATAGSRDGSARVALDGAAAGDVTPGFSVNTAALNPGSAPAAAIAALPTAGPSAGILMLGVVQKPTCAGCSGGVGGDAALPAGTFIASVRLRLQAAGGVGTVFSPAALDAAHGFRTAVRSGVTGVDVGTIAVGTLTAN
jgi:hypothetical protein